jgi:hypothetical protein
MASWRPDGPVRLDEAGDLVISPLTAEDAPEETIALKAELIEILPVRTDRVLVLGHTQRQRARAGLALSRRPSQSGIVVHTGIKLQIINVRHGPGRNSQIVREVEAWSLVDGAQQQPPGAQWNTLQIGQPTRQPDDLVGRGCA